MQDKESLVRRYVFPPPLVFSEGKYKPEKEQLIILLQEIPLSMPFSVSQSKKRQGQTCIVFVSFVYCRNETQNG